MITVQLIGREGNEEERTFDNTSGGGIRDYFDPFGVSSHHVFNSTAMSLYLDDPANLPEAIRFRMWREGTDLEIEVEEQLAYLPTSSNGCITAYVHLEAP